MNIKMKIIIISALQWVTGIAIYAVFAAGAVTSDRIVLYRMAGDYVSANLMVAGFCLAIAALIASLIYLIHLGDRLHQPMQHEQDNESVYQIK